MRPIARCIASIALGLLAVAAPARAQFYNRSLLVVSPTNVGMPGSGPNTLTNPNLLDPWGFSFSTGSPFWISDQASKVTNANGTTVSGVTTLTPVNQSLVPSTNGLIVNTPNVGNAPPSNNLTNGPTGQVSTGAAGITTSPTDFPVTINGVSAEANFIFANLDGSISAWHGTNPISTLASIVVPPTAGSNASFTGLAIGNATNAFGGTGNGAFLYAADQTQTAVDVFNSQWQLVGHLTDPNGIPTKFTAFNAQNINGTIYVTYADPTGGTGGIVDKFATNGTFLGRVITDPNGLWLDQPWGIAIAPSNFGPLSNDLLVGNNDAAGWINAFNATTGAFISPLMIGPNTPFSENGLWGLEFGNGGAGSNGPSNALFFTAGPDNATGIFGVVTVPEPSSFVLVGLGGAAALGLRRRLGRRA
jgi:uncharacterized protein (TIGR03118 family)